MERTDGTAPVVHTHMLPAHARLAATYDALAPRRQQIIARLGYPQAYANLVRQLRRDGWFAGLSADARMLDCGIGTGALSVALLQHLPFQQIDGVDIAPRMLDEAAHRLQTAGVTLHAHINDIQALPFDDATFDLVVSAHALEHLPNFAAGVRELVRVARPGAVMLLIRPVRVWGEP